MTPSVAERAFRKGIDSSVLFVPSQVYSQLMRFDVPWARKRVPLAVPFMFMGGRTQAARRSLASSGKRGCYVMPYSLLSTRDSEELLDKIRPGLIQLDEGHNLRARLLLSRSREGETSFAQCNRRPERQDLDAHGALSVGPGAGQA